MQTAALLNVCSAQNPWSMEVQFSDPIVMLVLNGILCMDTFFTMSAFISFFQINKLYREQWGAQMGVLRVLQLFLYRFLRFAPIVYIVFFFGVYVMPQLHGGKTDSAGNPIWPAFEEILFFECLEPKTIATKLFLVSNLLPWNQSDKSGCMQWTWTLECDMQLFLLVPFFVHLYNNSSKTFAKFMAFVLVLLGTLISFAVAHKNNLTAGILTMDNNTLYDHFLSKPHCKLHVFALGILCAMFFEDIKEYQFRMRVNRQLERGPHEKQAIIDDFPVVDYLQKDQFRSRSRGLLQKLAPTLGLLLAFLLIYESLFVDFPRQMDPFGWTRSQNAWYYALSRIAWATAFCIFFFHMVLGHNPIMFVGCRSNPTNFMGEMIWSNYLLCPLIYMNMYCTTPEAIYMTMLGNVILGMGSMTFTIIISVIFMLFIQYPVESIVKQLSRPMVVPRSKRESPK
uniref:Acyltransferase 3 domain-containing protein n=1 Tax=Strombidium rassoulzadegani TaxID=1082188 RepID=A0A7S3G093_9SPIT|mmetsp:Transcript_7401/g.12499  ORF Transcript_7401/g.12499 Transcript_7401/m.12499 type:complete len:453 (+) Transcript_7401:1308-2666(+)